MSPTQVQSIRQHGTEYGRGYEVDFDSKQAERANCRVLATAVKFDPRLWFLPREQPMQLLFLRNIFNLLRQDRCQNEVDASQEQLSIDAFHRAFERLLFMIQDPIPFSSKEYDPNGDGVVTWSEFYDVYKRRSICIKLSTCERIFLTLESPDSSIFGQIVSVFVLVVILVSSLCFILGTMSQFQVQDSLKDEPQPDPGLAQVDSACLVIFVIEYCMRLATCWNVRTELFRRPELASMVVGYDPIKLPPRLQRLVQWVIQPANIIDLAAILPAVIAMIIKSSGKGFVVLRLVRLTRIFRAFKSPAFIEPVIIISRTLSQSTKALYILCFNLILGIVISSSLMYLAEGQDRWEEDEQAFVRKVDQKWNATLGAFVHVRKVTPFKSIPATFWWSIVTVTTTGYGITVPTTGWGKLVAAMTMIFSLVILALPVGVIGGNFLQVWTDFDRAKQRDAEFAQKDLILITTSLQTLDPGLTSRKMLIEVWDDCGLEEDCGYGRMPGATRALCREPLFRFLGEAMVDLSLPVDQQATEDLVLPLRPNLEMADRKVTGEVTVRYNWTPSCCQGGEGGQTRVVVADPLTSPSDIRGGDDLHGILLVTVVSAERILNLGFTGPSGISSPYCVVFVYPRRPCEGGALQPTVWRTPTAWRTLSPKWEVEHQFAFDWRRKRRGLPAAPEGTATPRSSPATRPEQGQDGTDSREPRPPPPPPAEVPDPVEHRLNQMVQMLRSLDGELNTVRESVHTLTARLDWLALDPDPDDAKLS